MSWSNGRGDVDEQRGGRAYMMGVATAPSTQARRALKLVLPVACRFPVRMTSPDVGCPQQEKKKSKKATAREI